MKGEERMTYNEEKYQLIETKPKLTQMLELAEKGSETL